MPGENEKLLPCPFCGDEVELDSNGDCDFFWVGCCKCGVEQHGCDEAVDAIRRWNRRANAAEAVATAHNISRDAIAAVDRYMVEECVAMSTRWGYMQELRVWLQQHPC